MNDLNDNFKMHIVPHTHWDREWYYTLEEYRYRLIKLIDILLDCMEKDIITYFTLDGQTIALKDYLEIRPENKERIMSLTGSGRLIIGPWYTQPNVFMSGAEAQIRNLLFGCTDIEKYGAKPDGVNYMPDQFGYNSQLPQLMVNFGLEYLVGSRGMPKGCDTYITWKGSDGTKIGVCAMPHMYVNACAFCDRTEQKIFRVFGCDIVLPSLPDRLGVVLSEKERSPSPNLLAMNGVDHMFPNTSMLETIAKIKELHPDLKVVQSNFKNYISDVLETIKHEPHEYEGELRDPRENIILPASQSMRMDVKMYNARMEDLLVRRIEPLLCVMNSIGEKKLPFAEYRYTWELMLQNHAHDSLCCSNAEVSYREILTRYDKISDVSHEICNELEQRFIRRIEGIYDEAVILMNPSPFERCEPVDLDIIVSARNRNFTEPHLFYDGKEIPSNINGIKTDTLLRFVPSTGLVGQLDVAIFNMTVMPGSIPATGYKTLEILGGNMHDRPVNGIVTGLNRMKNEYISAEVMHDGTITVEDFSAGKIYTGLNCFMDNGEAGNGFQHIPPYKDDIYISCGKNLNISIVENNQMRGILKVTQHFEVPSGLETNMLSRSSIKTDIVITTNVILRARSKYLEFITEVDNNAVDHRLRVVFPTDINSSTAVAGQPFDVVRRPVQPDNVNHLGNGDYEAYVGYHPMHDFCDISDNETGVAIAGDGILEYEVIPMRNSVCLTLLRCTDRLLGGVLATGEKFRLPAAQLKGKTVFRYAFISHTGDYRNSLRQVEMFRHPLVYTQKDFLEAESMPDYVPGIQDMPLESGYITVTGDCVTTSIKPAEEGSGVIVRLFNPYSCSEPVLLTVDKNYRLTDAVFTRADETILQDAVCNGNNISFIAKAKEIITLKLNFFRSLV